jgi:cellulose synthase/poly-beta-1,6-N-acetylglucosamine synthase-like glycosyltransferase
MGYLIQEACHFLAALPAWSYVTLLWLTILAEMPRYVLGMQATVIGLLLRDHRHPGPLGPMPKVSILLAGHNEEDVIEKCVLSLYRQTFNKFEIVCVDDGSTDQTYRIMTRLRRAGLVQSIARLELRGGKASALNLAARMATGEIFVVIDGDCSFEPDAVEELLRPLSGAEIAASSGNILVRNWRASITASLQAIEYVISISLGKTFAGALDQVSCVSGAFGAVRRDAWEMIGGMDIGGGEDLDFTMRLRARHLRVVFARHSIAYTDVPATPLALWRQRNRWERDAIWVRYRKHGRLMRPLGRDFNWREALHQWEFVLFSIVPTIVSPFYFTWLLVTYEWYGVILLISVSLVLFLLDLVAFVGAVLVTGRPIYWRVLPFLPLFGIYQGYIGRMNRFYAYVTELIFSSSLQDNYVPQKVRDLATWR